MVKSAKRINKSKKGKKYNTKHKTTQKRKQVRKSKYSKKRKGGDVVQRNNNNQQQQQEQNLLQQQEQNLLRHNIQVFNEMVEEMYEIEIDENSPPLEVYNFMERILEMWNFAVLAFNNNPTVLQDVRDTINEIYDFQVLAVPQESAGYDDDEDLQEINNYRSSEILEELFHYVSNLEDEEIPLRDYDSFTRPDENMPISTDSSRGSFSEGEYDRMDVED